MKRIFFLLLVVMTALALRAEWTGAEFIGVTVELNGHTEAKPSAFLRSVVSDGMWFAGYGTRVVQASIYDGETYDARIPADWMSTGVPPAGFSSARILRDYVGGVSPIGRKTICLREDLTLRPKLAFVWRGVDGASDGAFGKIRVLRSYSPGGKIALAKPPPEKTFLPPSEQGPAVVMDCGGFGFQRGWQDAVIRSFPEDKVAEAAFGISRSSGGPGPLRLWVRVKDASPWVNGGGDPEVMFKGGDCIDLRWAADPKGSPKRRTPVEGDVRLLFAPDGKGGVAAVKYVFVDSFVAPDARRSFTSPTGTAYVDRIEAVPVRAKVEKTKDGYEFTADIPWKFLGENGKPAQGEMRSADVGVLFGDAGGATTVRRAYLFDQESQVVSDLPSEVRVNPSSWGGRQVLTSNEVS